jgi:hypothetical protein
MYEEIYNLPNKISFQLVFKGHYIDAALWYVALYKLFLLLSIVVFCIVTPCGLAGGYQRPWKQR